MILETPGPSDPTYSTSLTRKASVSQHPDCVEEDPVAKAQGNAVVLLETPGVFCCQRAVVVSKGGTTVYRDSGIE